LALRRNLCEDSGPSRRFQVVGGRSWRRDEDLPDRHRHIPRKIFKTLLPSGCHLGAICGKGDQKFVIVFKARCSTTAMGIMPYGGVNRALELALSLDIPFWPQLSKVSPYEDMCIQA